MEASARLAALNILNRYKPQDTNLSEITSSVLSKYSGMKDYGFARDLARGAVRRLKTIDGIISKFSLRKKIDPGVRNILRLGVFQLIYLKDEVPAYAAINESVELAKKTHGQGAANFVNAVLRKVVDGQAEFFDIIAKLGPAEAVALKYSFPGWMVKRWIERFGEEETTAFCEALNSQPCLTINTNTAKVSREELKIRLENEGAKARYCAFAPDALKFNSNPELSALGSFKAGLFWVQDEASQLVSHMLDIKPGESILDLCCGSGTKSAHMAMLGGGKSKITAVDSSAKQLEKARENFKVYGIKNAELVKADVLKLKNVSAKKVLLDAPCSGLGTIRHKPDIKWNRREADVTTRYPELQSALLSAAAACVEPGGALVYSTCTAEPEENEQVVERFLKENKYFRLESPESSILKKEVLSEDGKYLKTFSHRHGTDCFFAAKLARGK